ncbi:MAG: hypothetical protein JO046_23365 [Solirubrobacterales bacterium]|nr:hypothetical protein [Solirubrobacterales bacterium]
MAVPGDPVKIIGSPRAGTWDNGWTVWFLPWKQWLRGSALHEAVQVGPDGSTFVSPASPLATPAAGRSEHPTRNAGQRDRNIESAVTRSAIAG